jgi:hypothetical protein
MALPRIAECLTFYSVHLSVPLGDRLLVESEVGIVTTGNTPQFIIFSNFTLGGLQLSLQGLCLLCWSIAV